MKNILFVSGILLAFLACNGIEVESYDEGVLYERYQVDQDSLKHGIYKRFFKNGEIAEEAHFVHGKQDGKRTLFYIEGGKEIEEIYKMDSLHGTFKSFYPSGKMELSHEYVNNKIQGVSKKYYESGQLLEEVQFVDNNENGPFVEYYDNGQIEWRGKYLNGDNEFGLLENFDVNGVLIKKMECDSLGVCRTIWTLDSEQNNAE